MSTASQSYLDLGEAERAWPPAYNEVITRECPECGATSMELCVNPSTKKARKAPCIRRLPLCA
jgi:hypothetical protein